MTNELSSVQIKHIAKLANLELTDEEVEKFRKQLSEVLDYFQVLNEIKLEKVEPTSQTTGLKNIYRDDESNLSLSQKEALSGSKAQESGLFKIKAIFDDKS